MLDIPTQAIATMMNDIVEAIGIALGMAFFFLIFRAIVRVEWIALVLVIALYTLGGLENPLAVLFVALIVLLLRFSGVLTATVAVFSTSIFLNHAITLDTSAWFFPRSGVLLLALTALAAWAAWTSLGRKKLFALEL